MAKLNISLFAKIALSLIFLFSSAILVSGYVLVVMQNANEMAEKEKLAYASAKVLANGSLDALIANDFEFLEGWLAAVVVTDVYAYGYISDAKGKILVHSNNNKIASYTPTIKPFYLVTSRKLMYQGEPVNEIIYSAQIAGDVFANAHVAYYTAHNFFSIFKSKGIYILLAVLTFFLSMILMVTLFIIRLHTEPITKLSSNIRQFSLETQKSPIDSVILERPDEIGLLANSFQRLMARLKLVYQDLKNEQQNLQSKVEQRTKDLKLKNDLLIEMQQQLVESEKMASLGNLVAGVAHEINTPIGVCLTAISFLNDSSIEIEKKYQQQQLSQDDFLSFLATLKESSSIAIENISRAAALIKNFKNIAVDQHIEEKSCFNLNQHINHLINILKPNFKMKHYHFHISGNKQLNIFNYQNIFYQIFTNLIMNSVIHAFESSLEGEIKIDYKLNDQQLIIKYSDNGKGIAKEILAKVFDPFVTTKRGQGGSGLGTHIIYNLVVQKLKGNIQCESTLGKGTTFTIKLPYEACK